MQNAGKHSKNITIQGLRGASCIIVFLSHAFGMIPVKQGLFFEIPFLHLFYDGKIAVWPAMTTSTRRGAAAAG